MGCFDILPDEELHRSATCRVVLAIDCTPTNATHHNCGTARTSAAIQFMRNQSEFDKEVSARVILDNQCVVEIVSSYSASNDPSYKAEIESKGLEDYPYMIVMAESGRILSDVIMHGYVQPTDTDQFISCLPRGSGRRDGRPAVRCLGAMQKEGVARQQAASAR
jgi:hypothetical protein